MNDLIQRISSDRRYFAVAVALWLAAIAFSLLCVWLVFFRGDGSGGSPAVGQVDNTPVPTVRLGGATIVAETPVAGGDQPTQPPQESTSAPEGESGADREPLPPFPPDRFGYGVQVQGSVGDPATTIAAVQKLGMNWIKQQVRWEHVEPGPGDFNWGLIDGIIDQADQAGLYVMLSVVTAPEWTRANSGGGTHGPPDNYEEFGRFLGELIDRYQGKIHAIEVWNEQNLDREWKAPGGLIAADYVRLLQIAQREIRARDPNIIIISGALSPTGGWVEPDGRVTAIDDFTYFQQSLDAGMLEYVDCVGAHHNGINFPPDKDWDEGYNDASASFRGPFDNPHHSWSFKSTLQGYYDMMGGQRKLCVTEFGWATVEGFGGTPPGFEFAEDNTLEEQAEWVVQAFELQREWGITWIAYLWNLNYANTSQNPQDPNVPYSLVDFNGVPRPAFDALERMEKP
jgi:hypothetical protein